MRIRILDSDLYPEEVRDGFGPRYEHDAGVDLRAREDTWINPGLLGVIPLGVAVEIPFGAVGWVTGRSTSVIEMGLFITEGKIDSGYRGEIHAFALTIGGKPIQVKRGDRLAQLVIVQILPAEGWITTSAELTGSDRSTAGLGSSGRR